MSEFCLKKEKNTNKSLKIEDISDYVLELIFIHLNPYKDLTHILLVNKRWNRVAKKAVIRMRRFFDKCVNFSWRLVEDNNHLLSERCSHSACYYPEEHVMFMFGGCTNTFTAFNDLWRFDLSNRKWRRVLISRPPLPSAKALASLTLYNKNLILYGGFSKSSTNPIHQTTTFYNEIHLYNKMRNCWEEIICENTAPHLAGHTASIVGDFMLVFGGSMGSSYNNNVYVLDITRRIWNMPSIPGPCPPPRYGQSHVLLDDRHLVIIGGCGGPSVMFCDVWLLNFDLYGDTEWKWTQLKVENLDLSPPYVWCHRACKVGKNAVLLSRPTKICVKRLRNRRTSSQLSNSVRISSPDSPQDRRAVAAAFCSNSLPEQQTAQDSLIDRNSATDHGTPSDETNSDDSERLMINAKKKPLLLSSRSLDEQDRRKTDHLSSSTQARNSNSNYTEAGTSLPGTSGGCIRLSIAKNSELYRACSIPAIIVGEIPKLIVTSSIDHSQQPIKTFAGHTSQAIASSSSSNRHEECSPVNSLTLQVTSASETDVENSGNDNSDRTCESNEHIDAVRQFYFSLLREEYNRLKIVELNDNLKMEKRLNQFLRERVPYLSTQERTEMISELFESLSKRNLECDSSRSTDRQHCEGRLNSIRRRNSAITNESGETPPSRSSASRGSLKKTSSVSSSNASLYRASPANVTISSDIFGQNYYRHMCVYVLRLHEAIETKTVRWEQLPVEEDSPEDIILYSIVAARGELILFGGMQSDGGNGMDCLNVGMDRHTMNADTFILRPRYNDM